MGLEVFFVLKRDLAGIIMEKGLYVKDIKPDRPVQGFFLVHNCAAKKTKRGQTFWALQLADATGLVDAKVWNSDKFALELLKSGQIIEILQGHSDTYQENLQIIIENFRLLDQAQTAAIEKSYFQAESKEDALALWQELTDLLDGEFQASIWAQFTKDVFADPEIKDAFCACPGAVRIHHAYKGGLLTHTLAVCKLCQSFAQIYPSLDRKTLIAGALFHDIGKIQEYSYALDFKRTTQGQLLGHMVLGVILLEPFLQRSNLPEDAILHLRHLILSHHGRLEYGACEVPKTREALALHFADNLDSKMEIARAALSKVAENSWTESIYALDQTKLYAFNPNLSLLPNQKLDQTLNTNVAYDLNNQDIIVEASQKRSQDYKNSQESVKEKASCAQDLDSKKSIDSKKFMDPQSLAADLGHESSEPPWGDEVDSDANFSEYIRENSASCDGFDLDPPIDNYENMAQTTYLPEGIDLSNENLEAFLADQGIDLETIDAENPIDLPKLPKDQGRVTNHNDPNNDTDKRKNQTSRKQIQEDLFWFGPFLISFD